jgi:UDP-N-acetylglucosamine 2-epimerase (non-hydrolysing)
MPSDRMKIILVVGARPNFMKIAPILEELKKHPDEFDPYLVHTGQHYDEKMSKIFFEELGLPELRRQR